jgi:hypothetical protein
MPARRQRLRRQRGCVSTAGSYACVCKPGYSGDGKTCTAIDLCLTNNGGCGANATCTSVGPGLADCACKAGYQPSGTTCAAIDSCKTANGGCDANATCTQTGAGKNTCACNKGYAGNGMTCTGIDNCNIANSGCDANATCTQTGPGTNTCACNLGYVGNGMTCTAVAASLAGLRWELPCAAGSSGGSCTTAPSDTVMSTLGGVAGQSYNVTLRFRGVVEEKTYSGGTNDGAYWQVGGTPNNDTYNIYELQISSPMQTFYLNRGQSYIGNCWAIDYQETIQMNTGATVTLTALSLDNSEIRNLDTNGNPIVVPGIPPAPNAFDGQFIQMDLVSITPAM